MGRIVADLVSQSGETLSGGLTRSGNVQDLAAISDVVIDFTHASTVVAHAQALSAAGTGWVLGTTGLDDAASASVRTAASRIGVVQAANFSPGLALLTTLVQRLASSLPATGYDGEILEMHHRDKRDAPSGTALALGEAVASARGQRLADAAIRGRDGQTGPRRAGQIGFASLRGGGIVGEHAVSFTAGSERITVSHEAFDRLVFAEGALRAALWLAGRPPGLYTMADVLAPASGT